METANSNGERWKPPFSEFVFRALRISPFICLGIVNLTRTHHASNFDFWSYRILGMLMITLSLLQTLVSAWRLAVETMDKRNSPNSNGSPGPGR